MAENRNSNEWVIHIWGKKRDSLELTQVEKFHIDMIEKSGDAIRKFDLVRINIAMDDIGDDDLFGFLRGSLEKVFIKDRLVITRCQNDPEKGEYLTFRPYVFNRIGEPVNVFYSHFKGYSTYMKITRSTYPTRVSDLCEMYWSFLMYNYSFRFGDVMDKIGTHGICCWFRQTTFVKDCFFDRWRRGLVSLNPELKRMTGLVSMSPGSFAWYNLKKLGEILNDRPEILSIPDSRLKTDDCNLMTHFCELYLMQFLNEDEVYSMNDFNSECLTENDMFYTLIYPMKKVGREYLSEFEDYLIGKKMI